ncbi:MAG: chromosome segregation protein SMC [Pirellulales bacterium]
MLKALELAGFKSFADKTRFDFPDGITVVVGPNGSGKSNVVDAIKWVLGAQSAKALRGKDMVDVIFKGSASAGRKPCNSAEATLIFDNTGGKLPVDAPEVHVTRRVFRSGEGEYLINQQPCRLKDIKDLFRGTGVGVDAYSLIEQGKVDRMLQASPKDRRIIFEEAAGISRFKVKKTEALRRLQRVEQNLLRLRDIVDEVRGRLDSLKKQASKAQAYREMTARLSELRLQLSWTEYCEFETRKTTAETLFAQLQSETQAKSESLALAKSQAHEADLELHRVAERCQKVEAALKEALQQIAVLESRKTSTSERLEETQAEEVRARDRLAALEERAAKIVEEVDAFKARVDEARTEVEAARARVTAAEAASTDLSSHYSRQAEQLENLRREHVLLLRGVSELTNQESQCLSRIGDLDKLIRTTEEEIATVSRTEMQARRNAEQAAQQLKQIHLESNTAGETLVQQQSHLEEMRIMLSKRQEEAALANGRLEGARERVGVLETLVQQQEGIDAGARQLLHLAQETAEPLWQSVRGLVGDLVECDVHLAPLIDTALGTLGQAVVLSDGRVIEQIRENQITIDGRVTLLRLDRLPTRAAGERIQLDGVAGIIGRADRLIRYPQEFAGLFRYLLGTTWLVDSLTTAMELGHFRDAGLRFVTADCRLIDGDISVTLGALQAASGLVSRRSELAAAKSEIERYSSEYQTAHADVQRYQLRSSQLAPDVQALEIKVRELNKDFARQQVRAQQAVSRLDELEQQGLRLQSQLEDARRRRVEQEPELTQLSTQLQDAKAKIATVESELLTTRSSHEEEQLRLKQLGEELTSGRIELARSEQRYDASAAVLSGAEQTYRERRHSVEEGRGEIDRLGERQRQFASELETIAVHLLEAAERSTTEQAALDTLAAEASALKERRQQAHKQFESEQREFDKLSVKLQNTQMELERSSENIIQLLKRLQEDHQLALDDLRGAELITDAALRSKLESEAAQLKQDIAGVGNVNLAALAELDELQSRYDHLNGQYQDLVAAKESLQRIIQKINADSRRLFLETLEVIRANFQKLYRKSFGGGSADIILEEGEDVLECGVDIIATPPGKTALSNSLLSGGEKALTAVALLLAIFEFRPSPFCVLDEVDAPFDEANIGRFVNVLTEFLDWTKFIVVTHSKKTMTAGNTLYGVTMQESGVSKQVAVKFEDVSEDGEILTEKEGRDRSRRAA